MRNRPKRSTPRGKAPDLVADVSRRIFQDVILARKVGERLPTESKLAEQYSVSRPTVRAALVQLEHEGSIDRKPNRGAFVAQQKQSVWEDYVGRHVGLLIPRPHFAVFYSFLASIIDTTIQNLEATGMNTLICNRDWRKSGLGEPADYFKSAEVEGVLIAGTIPTPVLESIRTLNKPLVSLDCDLSNQGIPSVVFDDFGAGETVARRLHLLGHRRILCLFESEHRPQQSRDPAWTARRAGFMSVIHEKKLPQPDQILMPGRGINANLFPEIEARLRQPKTQRPTAVFIPDEEFHKHIVRIAQQCGLRVPQDLSVLCITGELAEKELSAVRFSAIALTETALDLMKRMILERKTTLRKRTKVIVPGRYVAGESHSSVHR